MSSHHSPAAGSERQDDPVLPRPLSHEPIAIVGIGCRLPGGANDPGAFWRLLCEGVDAVAEVPPDRWNAETFYDPEADKPGRTISRWGGFVEGIDQFDAGFFGISPREAVYMDPQQRLLLEASWDALEDGGQKLDAAGGSDVGVFVGISTQDYARLQSSCYDLDGLDARSSTGSAASIAANRISYCLNLRGPSVSVDTACSSSLVAVHLACRAIRNGDCKMALAAGVNLILTPDTFVSFSRMGMLSPEGRCMAFDASGKGFVRGEGVGVIVLKPLSIALAERDPIYAVIRGTAVNQDGHTNGMTVPSPEAQEAVMRAACEDAGVLPGQIEYIEAHGTGTPVGDPLEAHALGMAIGHARPAGAPLLIGSVKTNVGHLESAAGITGIIKLALALKHDFLPASLHFKDPNPYIPFEKLNLRVQDAPGPWPGGDGPRFAGINSFGFGGTNAHAVLASAPRGEAPDRTAAPEPLAHLLPLSARSPEALEGMVRRYIEFFQSSDSAGLAFSDVCYTAGARRRHHEHRMAIVATSAQEAVERLEAALSEPRLQRREQSAPVFVFSGQGPQWWGMGRELLAQEPIFRRKLQECDAVVRALGGCSLLEQMTVDESESRMDETSIAQPAICALQIALAALWESWGIRPAAIVGHSVGEIAAAHVAGALSLEDAMTVIFHRGRCMARANQGRMLAAGLAAHDAEALIAGAAGRVTIAALNSPFSVTLSGEAEPLEEIARELEAQRVFNRFLNVQHAFHSHLMEFVREDLLTALRDITPRAPVLPFISTVLGRASNGDSLDGTYWWHNVRQAVRFSEAVDALIGEGHEVFLELGPHPALATSLNECLRFRGKKGTVVSSLRRGTEERRAMLESLGTLHSLGHPVEWNALQPEGARCVRLPTYAWQRERFWNEAEDCREARLMPPVHPLLGRKLMAPEPMWQGKLDLRLLPWLEDHRVQGNIVFPAAAYVEMGLQGARVSFGGQGGVELEDVDFLKALFLPKSDEVQTAQLAIRPSDGAFTISARGADPTWTVHCVGKARCLPEGECGSAGVALEELKQGMSALDFSEGYRRFEDIGLQYGPCFRGIAALWGKPGEAVAEIRLPEGARKNLAAYRLHPALLDACFQSLLAAVPGVEGARAGLYLPVQIDRVRFLKDAGEGVYCHVRLVKHTPTVVEGHLRLFDTAGILVAEIIGFRCRAVTVRSDGPESDWLYEFRRELKPLPGREFACRPEDYLPACARLAARLQTRAPEVHAAANSALDELAAHFVFDAFKALGRPLTAGEAFTLETIVSTGGIPPERTALAARLLDSLVVCGLAEKQNSHWTISRLPSGDSPLPRWREFISRHPASITELMLIEKCGRTLPAALRGEADLAKVVREGGGLALCEHLLSDSPSVQAPHALTVAAICQALEALPEGRKVRILELCGGAGGLTGHLLPRLAADQVEYWFTDASPGFIQSAEERWRDWSNVKVALLDPESATATDGLPPRGFDVAIVSQAFSLTPANPEAALAGARDLLAPGGMVVMPILTKASAWLDVVLGAGGQGRPAHEWVRTAAGAGFEDIFTVSAQPDSYHALLLARAPATGIREVPEAPADSKVADGTWLIFTDGSGTGDALARRLQAMGRPCVTVRCGHGFEQESPNRYRLRPGSEADMRLLFETLKTLAAPLCGVVHLWNLDAPASGTTAQLREAHERGLYSVLHLVQHLAAARSERHASPRLWLVTRGALPAADGTEPVSIAQAPAWGLGRVILTEHADLRCRLVDLDPADHARDADLLLAELTATDDEEEIILRSEARYAQRMVRASLTRTAQFRPGERSAFGLEIPRPGVLDNLVFLARERRAPGPGEVEIEVCAAALNFRDTMKALGIYPTEADDAQILGDECAGRIVAVGPDVQDLKPGDEVLAIAAGCFASHVTTPAAFVTRKPAELSFAEAVTIPIPFLTAWYALHHLARITPGERVLIHAATGGVGLAAVQIAQQAGAEVFATAGSVEKRDFLRALGVKHVMDSRSLKFADEVMDLTRGEGVDIVLNSLAGEAIPRSLATLRGYGRFLEIGKRDIYQNSRLGLRPFRNNLSYFAIDLARTMQDRTMLVASVFHELMEHFRAGRLRPLPLRVFPVAEAVNAFRCMAQARHVGKVVLSLADPRVPVRSLPAGSVRFAEDATYLITGGLGGFGLELGKWLVQNGARHLVLVGRSGAATGAARQAVEALQSAGATVQVAQADISREEEVARVLAQIAASMPPLRGVFHAAMVLDDGLLLQQTIERFSNVMEPKVSGAWNLHVQTRDLPLDHFVLISSISAAIGNPGQSNYAAGNLFLDMLAHHRRALGLPALTVAWGALADAGYVARNAKVQEHLSRMGMAGLAPAEALEVLGRLLHNGVTQMTVARVDWRQLANVFPLVTSSPRFASLAGEAALGPAGSQDGAKLREAILAAPPSERLPLLETALRETIARVLRISPAKLDAQRALSELGLDSLMAFELLNRIESDFGVSVPTGKLMLSDNIAKLAEFMLGVLTGQAQSTPAPAVPAAPPEAEAPASSEGAAALIAQLDELTDEQVDTMLGDLVAPQTRVP